MSEVTRLLSSFDGRDPRAAEALLPLVYEELRRLARSRLARERPGHTLQATALVHEAYLRLLGGGASSWDHRGHFFAAAAEAMRRILIEHARTKAALKRGGGQIRHELEEELHPIDSPMSDVDDLLALDEALARFAREDPGKAELVKLLFFAGMSLAEAAEVLGISRATAHRQWTYARAWLRAGVEGRAPILDNPDQPKA
jgi:RNA polymerase sigma factor (TIGR02999 family)